MSPLGIVRFVVACASLVVSLVIAAPAEAQNARPNRSGEELFRAACAACHGPDGKGAPQSQVGFEDPLPDFTDCSFSTPEVAADWFAIAHEGGPVRAFSRRMPAFGEALTEAELERTVDYVRSFCDDPAWPRGELNFPRAMFTEKAYPENEAVLTTTLTRRPAGAFESALVYEHRIGRRAQYEIGLPVDVQHDPEGGWRSGLGDVNAAFKYAIFDSLERGAIVAAGGEVTLPTGRERLGGGTTIVEAFAMSGHALPHDGFLQFHAGVEVPTDAGRGPKEVYWRTAIGKTFFTNRWGRQWSPMAEVLLAKPLAAGDPPEWDVVPQMQVSLSGLQHVLVSVGLRVPVNERDQRGNALVAYLLWDWFDGGLFSNWRSR